MAGKRRPARIEPNPDDTRVIGTWRQWCEGDGYSFDVDKNIHGIGPGFVAPSPDVWHSVQVEIDSASSTMSCTRRGATAEAAR